MILTSQQGAEISIISSLTILFPDFMTLSSSLVPYETEAVIKKTKKPPKVRYWVDGGSSPPVARRIEIIDSGL